MGNSYPSKIGTNWALAQGHTISRTAGFAPANWPGGETQDSLSGIPELFFSGRGFSEDRTRNLVSGRGSFGRTRGRRFFRWRKQQVSRDMETGTQPLHHGHAQPLLALQDLADAARRSQDRRHVRTGETV